MNRRVERFENLTGGLNRFESGVLLRGGESPFLQNLTYRGGALCCRRGQKRLAQLRPGALCCAPELFHGWLVAHIGSAIWAVKLVRSERTERAERTIRVPLTDARLPQTAGTFFRWRDELYYKTRGAYVRIAWDEHADELRGTMLQDTANGTDMYIPVIQLNTDPATGAGDLYQPENRLSAYKKVRFTPVDGVAEYRLPVQQIDAVQAVRIDGALTTAYTVNRTAGTVTFTTAPAAREGADNTVEILYRKENRGAFDSIMQCAAAAAFGGARELCVVFGGPPAQPNAYFWSGGNGLVMDPTYFPVSQYNLAGETADPITCFGRQQNVLVVFQKHAVGRASLGEAELSGRVQLTLDYTRIHSSLGCDLPGSLQLVENNLVWCSRRFGVCRLQSSTAALENTIERLSRKIDGDDARPGLLRELSGVTDGEVCSFDTGSRYVLVLGELAYEWNYALSGHGDPSWFFHRGIQGVGFVPTEGGRLFEITGPGAVAEFLPVLADFGAPIEKVYTFPPRAPGGYDRRKEIESVLFVTSAGTRTDTRVIWTAEGGSRAEPTNLRAFGWTLVPRDLRHRDLGGAPYASVFRRRPSVRNVRHFGMRLENADAGFDLTLISAEIHYSFRGRQR